MAQRKRTGGRTPDQVNKKHRMDYLRLQCQAGKHLWQSTTSSGWRMCGICNVVECLGTIQPPLPAIQPDKPKPRPQTSLWD